MQKISKDHNKLFSEAQEKYLADRTSENLSELYLILLDYYQNLFINYSKKKGLFWDDDVIDEKAHDSSTRIIERFLKKTDFKVEKLTSYAHWDFIKILYQNSEQEQREQSYDEYSSEKYKIEEQYVDDDYCNGDYE